MSVLDLLGFATGALRGHALRTGLSMLGVGVGVAAVILLTGLGEGARRYVTDQFMSLGTNVLIVVPGRTETTGSIPGIGGTPRDLTIADAETLPRQARGIHTLAPVSMGNETVSGAGLSKQVAVVGTTAEMQAIRNIVMRQGQFLPEAEWRRGTSVAVLGQALADDLFPGEDPVGEVVRIGDFRMRVIGVMAPKGVTLGLDLDNLAMVPVATGMRMFDRTSLFRIMIQHDPRADVEALSRERHRSTPRAARRRAGLHAHYSGLGGESVQCHLPGAHRRAGRDRRHLPLGGRNRHHERHARCDLGTDLGDRPDEGGWRAQPPDPRGVSCRVGAPVRGWRPARPSVRPGRR